MSSNFHCSKHPHNLSKIFKNKLQTLWQQSFECPSYRFSIKYFSHVFWVSDESDDNDNNKDSINPISMCTIRSRLLFDNTDEYVLSNVCTDLNFRNKGFAIILLNEMKEWLKREES